MLKHRVANAVDARLLLVNLTSGYTGCYIVLNFATVFIATVLSVPGVVGMLFMKLLTNKAQIFADVRTYWSPEAVKEATGYEIEGVAEEVAREAFRLAAAKLSVQTTFVARTVL